MKRPALERRHVFSIRMKGSTVRALHEEALRYQTAPRTLAEQMVEEGVRMRRHPGIVFVERAGGRRDAALAARPRLSVWQIAQTARASTSAAVAAKYLSLDVPAVERALAYATEHADEIDRQIAANDLEMERLMRLYPSSADLILERSRASSSSSGAATNGRRQRAGRRVARKAR